MEEPKGAEPRPIQSPVRHRRGPRPAETYRGAHRAATRQLRREAKARRKAERIAAEQGGQK